MENLDVFLIVSLGTGAHTEFSSGRGGKGRASKTFLSCKGGEIFFLTISNHFPTIISVCICYSIILFKDMNLGHNFGSK